MHPTRILAKYKDAASLQNSGASLQALGLSIQRQFQLVPGLVVLDSADNARQMKVATVPEDPARVLLDRIQALEESGAFEYVQPSYIYHSLLVPNDSSFTDGTLWGLRNTGSAGGVRGADIGAVAAWDLTTGSTNVIVAIVDSGIRYSHQELSRQMWRNPGEIAGNGLDDDKDGWIDNVFGINAVTRSGDPFDDNDHGTHVAGIIGAAANDGNPHVGVAWHVRLMACKFLAADGFGTSDDALAAIDFAVKNGARVINGSFAGGTFERAFLDALIEARKAGVLFVAAAGNDFSDNDSYPVYPASYQLDNVIAVAAIDRQDHLADFSNYGRGTVHLGAPGVDIFSSIALSDAAYETFSGTSMAAPHVAGVAALLLAKYPNASVPELRERLLSTVVQVPTLADKTTTGGRVNAYRALSATPDGTMELAFDPPENSDLSARRPVPFYVTVTDLSGVTNATVRARVDGAAGDVVFQNNGVSPDFKAADEVYSATLTLPTAPGAFQITFTVEAPGKTNIVRTVNYNIASPPLNDNFADALEFPSEGGTLQWTNRFATIETSEPKHAQIPSVAASVWWNWTPRTDTPVIVDTTGSAFDTVLAVYTNSTLQSLKEVASADDAGSHKQGYVTFNARAGIVYHIAVAGFSAADVGVIRLRVEPGGGPDVIPPLVIVTSPDTGLVVTNTTDAKIVVSGTAIDPAPNVTGVRQVQVQVNRDVASTAIGTTNWSSTVLLREGQNRIKVVATDFAGNASPTKNIVVTYRPLISPNDDITNAIPILGTTGTMTGNNSRATRQSGEPTHAGNAGGKSIWWSFQPTLDGVLSLSTANSSFNTLLALYSGAAPQMSALAPLASNDDAQPDVDFSKVAAAIKAGETYYIAVDGFGGSTGLVQLAYSFVPATVCSLKIDPSEGGSVLADGKYFESGAQLTLTATADPFYYFDHWEGSVTSTENPLHLQIMHNLQLVARFRAQEFSDGFESGDLKKLAWKTSGNLPWAVQGNIVQAGKFAARSGAITNGQKSSLQLTSVCRAGTGSFAVRVSSEPTWDVLGFYLNGRELVRWSGESGWTNFTFNVPAGTNTMEWRYSKDHLNSAGWDGAAIDSLDLPLAMPVDASTPAKLVLQRFADGEFQLNLAGQTGQTYQIQSSPDLVSWQTVSTNVARAGAVRWDNHLSGSVPRLFYRAIVP